MYFLCVLYVLFYVLCTFCADVNTQFSLCTNEQPVLFVLNYTYCHYNIFTDDKFTHSTILYIQAKKKDLDALRTILAETLQDILDIHI